MDQENQQSVKTPSGITNIIVKLLPILSLVFVIFAVLAFVYYFISGIIAAAKVDNFSWFIDGIVTGIQRLGFNVFAAAVLAGIAKLIGKKQD